MTAPKINVGTSLRRAGNGAMALRLDSIEARASGRFGAAVAASLLVHLLMTAGWLSVSIIRQPEILEIREVSFVDENEVTAEAKANRRAPALATSSRTATGEAAGSDNQNAAVNAEAGGEEVDVNKVGVLGLLEGVSQDAAAEGNEITLSMKEAEGVVKDLKMNRSLTTGRGQNPKAGVKDDALVALSKNGRGIDDLLKVDMNAGAGIALKKGSRVEVGGLSGSGSGEGNIGSRSEVSLYDVLNKNLGRLQYIFEKHLRAHPDIGGKIEVEVTINPDGAVAKVLFLASEISVAAFRDEITAAIRRWKYAPVDAGVVKVVYPIVFVKAG